MRHTPSSFVRPAGAGRDWVGEAFLGEAGTSEHGSFEAAGSYSYLTDDLDDWSAVDLNAHLGIAEGFAGGLAFHHENRDEQGELGVASLLARVNEDLLLVNSVGFGSGAHYLPITQLDVEARHPIAHPGAHLALALGYSWWTETRTQFRASLAAMHWRAHGIRAEVRGGLSLLDSPTISPRVLPMARTRIQAGEHGVRTYQGELGIDIAPKYAPRVDLALLDELPRFDMRFAVRQWIGPRYGVMGSLELGGQEDTFFRFGLGVSVFARLWQ
jgi:YaiO family outer membrane protein